MFETDKFNQVSIGDLCYIFDDKRDFIDFINGLPCKGEYKAMRCTDVSTKDGVSLFSSGNITKQHAFPVNDKIPYQGDLINEVITDHKSYEKQIHDIKTRIDLISTQMYKKVFEAIKWLEKEIKKVPVAIPHIGFYLGDEYHYSISNNPDFYIAVGFSPYYSFKDEILLRPDMENVTLSKLASRYHIKEETVLNLLFSIVTKRDSILRGYLYEYQDIQKDSFKRELEDQQYCLNCLTSIMTMGQEED